MLDAGENDMTRIIATGPDELVSSACREDITLASPRNHLNRRSFLAASGLGTAALLAPALWTPASAAFVANPWARADAIVARITVPTFPARDFPITGFGAVGNGTTDCTAAIAGAIGACHQAGGGRVVVPA